MNRSLALLIEMKLRWRCDADVNRARRWSRHKKSSRHIKSTAHHSNGSLRNLIKQDYFKELFL